MNNSTKFISGNEYNIGDLFGGDNKIVIPDLQRDYCWGDKAYSGTYREQPTELVTNFVKNIIAIFKDDKRSKVTMGIIYGYEQPQNHIQICDGQQRLTTLFLLLGYLNYKTKGGFVNNIISIKEMNDDYEPHLLYSIRESTLYFLSDLSLYCFIERKNSPLDIRNSEWFFDEYDEDASIQSMIAALHEIDGVFSLEGNIDLKELGDFILSKLYVLYYDMENRSRGEETYIVINTTGEPLTPSENIKPILIGAPTLNEKERKKYSMQWEEREEWFWQNRGDDKTADNGMLDFFVKYWQIGLLREDSRVKDKIQKLNPYELFLHKPKTIRANEEEGALSELRYEKFKNLDNIEIYFQGLKELVEAISKNQKLLAILSDTTNNGLKEAKSNHSTEDIWNWVRKADLDIILPLISLLVNHGDKNLYAFARRLRRNYYDRKWQKDSNNETSRRGKNYVGWKYIVQIIEQTNDDNLFTVDERSLKISSKKEINWFNEDEKAKIRMRSLDIDVETMEDNEVLKGDLTPIWEPIGIDKLNKKDADQRFLAIERICNALNEEKASKDIIFSNWFRIYRLVSGTISVDHIYGSSWKFKGCFYSKTMDTPWWIEKRNINDLINSTDPISFLKEQVKEKTKNYISHPQDVEELVMSWLTLKTIKADKEHFLLNYFSKRPISAYKEIKDNYVVQNDEFHWGNIICGYSNRDRVCTANEYNWGLKENLDSPITSLSFHDYICRNENSISDEDIKRYDEEVNKLICSFYHIQTE